jgi:hypothetical protein
VAQIEAAVLDGRFADVEPLLGQTEAAFGCSPPATPPLLARMWGAEGVWLSLTRGPEDAVEAFAAAQRVDATTWNPDFGDQLRATAQAAVAARAPVDTGRLQLAPDPVGWTTYVDGRVAKNHWDLAGGLHLVQLVDPHGHAGLARLIFIESGQIVELSTHSLPTTADSARPIQERFPRPAPIEAVPPVP